VKYTKGKEETQAVPVLVRNSLDSFLWSQGCWDSITFNCCDPKAKPKGRIQAAKRHDL